MVTLGPHLWSVQQWWQFPCRTQKTQRCNLGVQRLNGSDDVDPVIPRLVGWLRPWPTGSLSPGYIQKSSTTSKKLPMLRPDNYTIKPETCPEKYNHFQNHPFFLWQFQCSNHLFSFYGRFQLPPRAPSQSIDLLPLRRLDPNVAREKQLPRTRTWQCWWSNWKIAVVFSCFFI